MNSGKYFPLFFNVLEYIIGITSDAHPGIM